MLLRVMLAMQVVKLLVASERTAVKMVALSVVIFAEKTLVIVMMVYCNETVVRLSKCLIYIPLYSVL